jgi:hypothetical protein
MYDGSNTYDFDAALAEAKTAEPKSGLTVEQIYWRQEFPEAPTRDELARHIERFGPECVEEFADAYGIELDTARARKPTAFDKRRASGLALLEEGKSLQDVALAKGVEVKTVRRWQREAEGLPKAVEIVRARGRNKRLVEPQKI